MPEGVEGDGGASPVDSGDVTRGARPGDSVARLAAPLHAAYAVNDAQGHMAWPVVGVNVPALRRTRG